MNGACDQLLTRPGFTQNQDRAVALRHHFDLLEDAVHRFAAANDFAELTFYVVELFSQRQVFIDQAFLQSVDLLIGKGVIHGNRHALGNLAQQFEVGSGEHFLFALRQLKYAEHIIAGH